MKKKKTAADRWARYREQRESFYFFYPTDRPNTYKLLDTGKYGVVQLICIENEVRRAFMAGLRAGRRASTVKGDA